MSDHTAYPISPMDSETRRVSGNFQRALNDPATVSLRPVDARILAAMSEEAVLRDVYRRGYKLKRPPLYERTLTMPDGVVQSVSRAALERLRDAGMIATHANLGGEYDAVWLLTLSGLAASPNPDAEVETYDPAPKVETPVDPDCPF